ncbi:MAG: glycoside hydrolase family 127 protein [Candidatus Thorarchaeota archaeon]
MKKRPYNKLTPISFHQVEIIDNFWSKRQKINRDISIHLQHQKLEAAHHIDNFRVAAGVKEGTHKGEFYYDADLYKWFEAACYISYLNKSLELDNKINEIKDLIIKSQIRDGYLNTYYSTKFIHRRFTNLQMLHELFCAGHLIQAAIAYYDLTESEALINVVIKYADFLVDTFLKRERNQVPGHEEIEMALIELYRFTDNENYLKLAKKFINGRGKIRKYKTYALNQFLDMLSTSKMSEKIEREYEMKTYGSYEEKSEVVEFLSDISIFGWIKLILKYFKGEFNQLNVPVREAYEPVGHAVRAMYLYCGMADLYSETGDKSLLTALELIWLKMIKARMYITGGTGSVRSLEGFDKDFALKNEKSYSETCAAIGNMMWNWRMLQITGKCKFADLIEKLLYNAMLVGQSIDGKSYTYTNPLVSEGNDKRHEWFMCACCPPNVARTISSLGKYIYSVSEKGIWIHQYIGSKMKTVLDENKKINLNLSSDFPWDGKVKITLELKGNQNFSIFLRIPNWCNDAALFINNTKYQGRLPSGKYIEIIRNWNNNDVIKLNLKMEPKLELGNRRIKENRGRVAISFGPLIYCMEQIDNTKFNIFRAEISRNSNLRVSYKSDLLGGINVIEGNLLDNKKFVAIPYYSWCNRGPNKMQIWHKREKYGM